MTEHLALSNVSLDELAEALDDHSDWSEWWFDPATGQIVLSMDEFVSGVEDEVDTDGMIAIDPLPARRAYDAMVEFADAVGDPRAREALQRSLDGKGAFRRFRRALDDFTDLGLRWRDFERLAAEMRAVDWLRDHDIVRPDDLAEAFGDRRRRADAIVAEIGHHGSPRFERNEVPQRWTEVTAETRRRRCGHTDARRHLMVRHQSRRPELPGPHLRRSAAAPCAHPAGQMWRGCRQCGATTGRPCCRAASARRSS